MACGSVDIENSDNGSDGSSSKRLHYNLRVISMFGILQFVFGCTFVVFGQVMEESQINHDCTYNTTIWCPIFFTVIGFLILVIAYSDQRNPSKDNRYLYILTALTLLQLPVAVVLGLGSFSRRCSASSMGITGSFAMLQFFFGTVQVALSIFSTAHILSTYCRCSTKKSSSPSDDSNYFKGAKDAHSESWIYNKNRDISSDYDSLHYQPNSNDSTIDSGRGSTSSCDASGSGAQVNK